MSQKAIVQIVAIAIGLAAALAGYNLLSRSSGVRPEASTAQIGQIQEVDGSVERRFSGAVTFEALKGPRPLHDRDLVVTQSDATAVLALNAGTSLRLAGGTRFVAEIDSAKPSVIIGTILDGSVSVLSAGANGTFRLMRDGREVPLDQADKSLVPVVPSTGAAQALEPALVITATLPDESATPSPRATPSLADGVSDVLTNEDIVRVLKAQTGFFQRCYLNFLHREQAAEVAPPTSNRAGQIVIGFVIQPTGRVTDTKIVKSDFGDTTLENCVGEVVGRTRFKGFRGEKPVPVTEFPISLQ